VKPCPCIQENLNPDRKDRGKNLNITVIGKEGEHVDLEGKYMETH
jgi:hypothetical protein